ncbi:cAMP-dependent protein kinase regulatory subunit [Pycnococcus provasolii]
MASKWSALAAPVGGPDGDAARKGATQTRHTSVGSIARLGQVTRTAEKRMVDAAKADSPIWKEMVRLNLDPHKNYENAATAVALLLPMLSRQAFVHRTAAEVRLFTEVTVQHLAGFEQLDVPLLHRLGTCIELVSAPAGEPVQQPEDEPAALWVLQGSIYESSEIQRTAHAGAQRNDLAESHEEYARKRRSPDRRSGVATHGPGEAVGTPLAALGSAAAIHKEARKFLRAMPSMDDTDELERTTSTSSAISHHDEGTTMTRRPSPTMARRPSVTLMRNKSLNSNADGALAHVMKLSLSSYEVAQQAHALETDADVTVRKLLLTPKRMRTEDQVKALQSKLAQTCKFFAKISDPNLVAELCRNLDYHLTPANSFVFHQGDEGDLFYVVISGRCKVVDATTGRTLVEVPSGGEFGELALMKDAPRAASIVAMEDCEFATLSKIAYQRTLKRVHAAALKTRTDFIGSLDCFKQFQKNALNKASYFFRTIERAKHEVALARMADCGGKIYFLLKGECRIIAPIGSAARADGGTVSQTGASLRGSGGGDGGDSSSIPSLPRTPTPNKKPGRPWAGSGQRKAVEARGRSDGHTFGDGAGNGDGVPKPGNAMRQILTSTTIATLSTRESFGAAHALGIANNVTDNLKVICATSCTLMCIDVHDLANLVGEAMMIGVMKDEETKEEWYASRIRKNTESRTEMKRKYDAAVKRLRVATSLAASDAPLPFEAGRRPPRPSSKIDLPSTISAVDMHDLIFTNSTQPMTTHQHAQPSPARTPTPNQLRRAEDRRDAAVIEAALDAEVAALAAAGRSPGIAALGNLVERRDRWSALQMATTPMTVQARHAAESSKTPLQSSTASDALKSATRRVPLQDAASASRSSLLYHNTGVPSRPSSLPLLMRDESDDPSAPSASVSAALTGSDAHVYLITPINRRKSPVAAARSSRMDMATPYRDDLLESAKSRYSIGSTPGSLSSTLRESRSESLVLSSSASPSSTLISTFDGNGTPMRSKPWRSNLCNDTRAKLHHEDVQSEQRKLTGTKKKSKKTKRNMSLVKTMDNNRRLRILEGRPTAAPDAESVSTLTYVLPCFDSRHPTGFVFDEY